MVDRYAADMQDQRAFEAKRRRGDMSTTRPPQSAQSQRPGIGKSI